MASLIIIPNKPLTENSCFLFQQLCWFREFNPWERKYFQWFHYVGRWRLPPGHSTLLVTWTSKQRKALVYWLGWLDSDYQGEISFLVQNEGSEDCVEPRVFSGMILSTSMLSKQKKMKNYSNHKRQDNWGLSPFRNEGLGHSTQSSRGWTWEWAKFGTGSEKRKPQIPMMACDQLQKYQW